jgi:hypothetical protein
VTQSSADATDDGIVELRNHPAEPVRFDLTVDIEETDDGCPRARDTPIARVRDAWLWLLDHRHRIPGCNLCASVA